MSSAGLEPPSSAADHSVSAHSTLSGDQGDLFVRKSSGLVREMGWRDSVSVALSGINPATVVAIFFSYLVFASDADLTWPYVAAMVVMLPLTFAYGQLVATMPRSGGDFVFHGRIFAPWFGAAVGGGMLLFFLLQIATNSVFVGQLSLPEFFQVAGSALHSHGLTTFASTLGKQSAEFITAGLIVLGLCLIGMRGPHVLARVMFWCFVAGMVGVLLLAIVALTHSNTDFRSAYDHRTHPGAYAAVIAAAHQQHIHTGSTFSGFLKIMPFAATGFWGFTLNNISAGEIKRPGRTYYIATLVGLVAGVIFLQIGWQTIKHLAGLDFMQSAAGLNAADPAKFAHLTGGASTVTQFYADVVAGSPVLRLVMSAGFVIGGLMFPLAMVLVVSRLIFALSFDRLLPERLAEVSEKTHAPVAALAVCALGGLGFVALVVFSTGYLRVSRNGIVVWATLMTLAGIAATVLPFRRRELFAASPKLIRGTWLGLPPIAIIGAVTTITQGGLAYYALTNKSLSGGYDTGSIIYLVATPVFGVVLYLISRVYLSRVKGIDLNLAMQELPPE